MVAKKTAIKVKAGVTPKEKGPNVKLPKQIRCVRKDLERRVENLTREVRDFLAFPRPDLILAKEWLHDADIPCPEADLLGWIAHEMLYGRDQTIFFEAADRFGMNAAFSCLIDHARKMDLAALKFSLQSAVARLTFIGWWGGQGREHWWLCRWGIDNDHVRPDHENGAHRIAHAMNELLVVRSLYRKDWTQINELAAVTKAIGKTRKHRGLACIEVVLKIFSWHGHLSAKLGRAPSREELKSFILELEEGISNRKETWCDAFNYLLLEYASPRSIRMDKLELTRLARLARKTGPQKPATAQTASLPQPESAGRARRC